MSPNSLGPNWIGQGMNPAPGGFAFFEFVDEGPEPPPFSPDLPSSFAIGAVAGSGAGGGVTAEASGTWTITDTTPDTTTPEPSYLILMSTGLLALAFVGRKRRAQGLAVRPPE